MFDARNLLNALVNAGSQPQQPPPSASDPASGFGNPQPGAQPQGGISLHDLLGSAFGRQGDQGGQGGAANLQDALRNLLGGQAGQGNPLDVLKQVLGQATSGVREGAGQVDQATGLSQQARDAIQQATGQTPEQLMAQLRELIANNQGGATAALGGLGALILGTQAGRSLAGSAIKIGGLALIGGLAYKAYQNYQQGLPPLTGASPTGQEVVPAPRGSGFEPAAVSHDQAMHYMRAMIAATAADGRIDDNERQKLLAGLQQAGMEQGAQEFLAKELSNPATVEDLAAGTKSPQDAIQVYTAARLAVDHDSPQEEDFLKRLAAAMNLPANLKAQVDATARTSGAAAAA